MLNRLQQAVSLRRHSSPVLPIKSDHVAEIARLIGLVSAESQNLHNGGGDGSAALNELKSYVQKWPDAQETLEEQVGLRQEKCGLTRLYFLSLQ